MRFTVKFTNISNYSINFRNTEIGLKLLDQFRKELALPSLDVDLFPYSTPRIAQNLVLELSEVTARASKHFIADHFITVNTPFGFLNEFCSLHARPIRNGSNDAITSIEYYYVIDESAILQKWIADEFPLEY